MLVQRDSIHLGSAVNWSRAGNDPTVAPIHVSRLEGQPVGVELIN